MGIVKNFKYRITSSDRIQIRLESNFSVAVLDELLALRPIEINARMDGDTGVVGLSLPQGLSAVVLSEDSDCTKPYFADIETIQYSRLSLDLLSEEQSWYIAFSSVYGTSLDMLATKPIVIKFFESHRGYSILFGADEAFRIVNARDTRYKKVVSDPSKIPDALLRLVEVIDEPLPDNRISLERLEERVRTTKKLLELYTRKQFSLEVKEEIQLSIAELHDFELKVQAKIEQIKFGAFGFEAAIFSRVTSRLKQITGTKRFEQLMATVYKEVMTEFEKRQASEQFIKEGNVFERILESVDGYGVKQEVLRHLNGNTHKAFFAISCGSCGGDPVITKGQDNKYRVTCKDCGRVASVDYQCKSRSIAIRGWNTENATDDTPIEGWMALLGLDVKDLNQYAADQYLATIRSMNRCLTDMMSFWKAHISHDVSSNTDYSAMHELLEMIKFIGTALREKKKTLTGASNE